MQYTVDGRRGHGGRIYHISSPAGGQYINVDKNSVFQKSIQESEKH